MSHNIYKRIEIREDSIAYREFLCITRGMLLISFHFISTYIKADKAFLGLCACRAYIDNGFIHRDTLL